MEAMTVGEWLLANEVKRQVDAMTDFDRRRSADSVKEADMRHIHAWCGPGMADLRAVAESEGEERGVNEKWLRKRRGDLVIAGATAAEIDALTMPQFFLALTGRREGGAPEAATKTVHSGKWKMVKALLENEPDSDSWSTEKRREIAKKWNAQNASVAGWLPVSTTQLGQLIRDRRRRVDVD